MKKNNLQLIHYEDYLIKFLQLGTAMLRYLSAKVIRLWMIRLFQIYIIIKLKFETRIMTRKWSMRYAKQVQIWNVFVEDILQSVIKQVMTF